MTTASDPPEAVRAGYRLAAERFGHALASGVPVVSRTFRIADRLVRLRVVGPRLADGFAQPWRHLEIAGRDESAGGLTIDLWHGADTGLDRPATIDAIDPLERFPYRASPDDRYFSMRQPATAAWLDRETGHLVGVVDEVERRTLYEAGRPIETPLLVWLRDQGVPLVHASFVAHEGRGALILGRSGSGKSTLAALCLCDGFEFLSDDKIALGQDRAAGRATFTGYSLSSSLHVDRGSLDRLPRLAAHAAAPALALDDKFRVPIERLYPSQLRASARISALVLPSLAAEPGGRVEPASPREAFLALSLSTVLSLPIARRRSLDPLGALAETTPAFTFDVNPAATAIDRLAALLETSD